MNKQNVKVNQYTDITMKKGSNVRKERNKKDKGNGKGTKKRVERGRENWRS